MVNSLFHPLPLPVAFWSVNILPLISTAISAVSLPCVSALAHSEARAKIPPISVDKRDSFKIKTQTNWVVCVSRGVNTEELNLEREHRRPLAAALRMHKGVKR